VSRGGRPDLAGDSLERVQAPTLAIVGSNDPAVLELNRQALARMNCVKALHVIPGASHLFEEAGALEEVAKLARAWFIEEL
jgi:pimeloyl-ACP methyl ester carboxylesterase